MRQIAAACFILIMVASTQVAAEEVPFKIQAALVTKMLAFENNWEKSAKKDTLNIGIAYRGDEKARADARAMADELGKLKAQGVTIKNHPFVCLTVELSDQDRLTQWLKENEIHVLYVAGSRGAVSLVTGATQAAKVLSVAGDNADAAVKGGVAIGFTSEENKPVILVNLASVLKESKEFSPQFLSLVKLVNK